ncbi:hypothetical protein [Bordetella genomosp. 13]|uniref:hypothetical protein n=1 Tax=Bordetella genomosp. 13 TaxID=463040 RepID=UPI0011A6936A|nr:hypothetical protein [Bordetella genomosp. 13]
MPDIDEYPLQIGPGYICFWENSETGEYSAPEDEAHFTYAFIQEKLAEVFAVPDSFIGVTDAHGNTLQFDVQLPDEIWLDIPLLDKAGSLRKQTDLAEAQALIGRQADDLGTLEIDGLMFQAWE